MDDGRRWVSRFGQTAGLLWLLAASSCGSQAATQDGGPADGATLSTEGGAGLDAQSDSGTVRIFVKDVLATQLVSPGMQCLFT